MRGFLIGTMAIALFGYVGPFSEDFESRYSDVNTARTDGAFNRGWLPEIVPDDSIDIREIHNIDTNLTWGCFVIPSGTEGRGSQETQAAWCQPSAGSGEFWSAEPIQNPQLVASVHDHDYCGGVSV